MGFVLLIDTGTTNTRVWRVAGSQVVLRLERPVGVRDTARDGSSSRLHAALGELVAEASGGGASPDAILTAGMATSPLGLGEAPHVVAPAGLDALAAGCVWRHIPTVGAQPVILVPGVRTPPTSNSDLGDVMRGEETLAMGLLRTGLLAPSSRLLTFGSHWKAIDIDERSRIAWSRTAITGELIDAVRTQTVLAGSLPRDPALPDVRWVEAGAAAIACDGLARTLFGIRLLDQQGEATPDQRFAYLLGACVADAEKALLPDGVRPDVVLSGHSMVCEAWRHRLRAGRVLTPLETERGFVDGLLAVWARFRQTHPDPDP
jgi:2-dehydro-3-deoxygalactonokinase